MLVYFLISVVFLSLFSFCLNRKHLLSLLLSLEFIALSLFGLIVLKFSYYNYESFFLMVFLTFAVCEGSLGLSILVSMVRTHGNDYFSSFNVLW
uniref:NADH-ubiquinone oxidoreductase chain 4L n=1 Tax=Apatides fortis TaxID=590156 RepID=D1G5P4_APAFO|nr:NADH dehydrogenase subunit 4L [Apatides fortis]ACM45059.1 NADH dehydrogenase subunit 4L [Apatides fortis]